MEEGAKRRLIGAAVMVALLVIFLPMFLEEDTESPVSEGDMSIPPRPDFGEGYEAPGAEGPIVPPASTFSEYEEPITEDAQMPLELAPPALYEEPAEAQVDAELAPEAMDDFEDVPPPAPEPDFLPEPEPEPEAVSGPAPLPEPQPEPVAEPAPTPVVETSKPPPPEPAPTPRPAPEPRSQDLYSWVIQVASLREHGRAYALVQDLRDKGFPAYLEEAEVHEKQWHRVRVGPEISRKRIESMAASLREKTGLKVQIQRFP